MVNVERLIISEVTNREVLMWIFVCSMSPTIYILALERGHLLCGLKRQFWIGYRALIFSVDKNKSFPVGQTMIKGMVPVYDEVRLEMEVVWVLELSLDKRLNAWSPFLFSLLRPASSAKSLK